MILNNAASVELTVRLIMRILCHFSCGAASNERIYVDEIPADFPVTQAIAPECDMLCHLAEQELSDAA